MAEIKHRAVITVDFMSDDSVKYEYNLSPRSPQKVEDEIRRIIGCIKDNLFGVEPMAKENISELAPEPKQTNKVSVKNTKKAK